MNHRDRVAAFAAAYRTMTAPPSNMDPSCIHTIGVKGELFTLRIEDLEALLADTNQQVIP